MDTNEMKKIALSACIEMIGEALVMQHKDLCCCTCGMMSDGLFHYSLGVDIKERAYKMGDEIPFEYVAFVVVNPESGEVTRDYKGSFLP